MKQALPNWVDGRFFPPGAAAIPADDRGFALGLAVFESMLQTGGHRYFEAQHLARLGRGASVLGIEWPPQHDAARALDEYGSRLGDGSYAVRLTISRGSPGGEPRMVITARVVEALSKSGVAVSIARHHKVLDIALEGTKSTSRLRNVLSLEEARAEGAWDAIVCTEHGDLSEGTISNLFMAQGDRLVTPALDRGALPGVIRGELLAGFAERGTPVEERRIARTELTDCDELFMTNSVIRIAPVHTVLGSRADLPGPTGTWTRRALEILRDREVIDRDLGPRDPA